MPERQYETWLRKLRPGRPLLEAWILSVIITSISNVLAQLLEAYTKEVPFVFDLPRLLRFVCLDLITAPLNFKWQELLEHYFPRHEHAATKGTYESIPLEEHDVEKDSDASAVEENEEQASGSSSPPRDTLHSPKSQKNDNKDLPSKKNWENIWTKWFIDCITLGAVLNTFLFLVIMGFLNGQPEKIPHNLRHETVTIIVNGYKLWPFMNIIAHSVISFERRIPFFSLVALCWNIYLSLVAARL